MGVRALSDVVELPRPAGLRVSNERADLTEDKKVDISRFTLYGKEMRELCTERG